MDPSDAALLTALLVVTVLIVVWCARRRGDAGPDETFCPGPYNIGLYDHPYKGYPVYLARGVTWWDRDHRCAAYCASNDCAIWCR